MYSTHLHTLLRFLDPAYLPTPARLRLLPPHDALRLADIVSLVLSFPLSFNLASLFLAALNYLRGLCRHISFLYSTIDYLTSQSTRLCTVIRLD
jgi:hypothetical protein